MNSKHNMIESRNYLIDVLKMVAAVFIVFLHYPFPEPMGQAVDCCARFAVPFFFAVSGYYAYGASSKRIIKRMWKIVVIMLLASFLFFCWHCFKLLIMNGSVITYIKGLMSFKVVANLVFLGVSPFFEHLWYLSAMVVVYLIFYLYTLYWGKDTKYYGFYVFGLIMLQIHIVLSMNCTAAEIEIPTAMYRNALLFGIPLFAMGIFLRENLDVIVQRYNVTKRKAYSAIVIGFILSLLQWFGFGKAEMPVGMLLVVTSIILIAAKTEASQCKAVNTAAYYLGKASLIVYIVHPLLYEIMITFEAECPALQVIHSHGYFFPIVLAAASMIIGIVFTIVANMITMLHQRF